jgi:hypothetical protein
MVTDRIKRKVTEAVAEPVRNVLVVSILALILAVLALAVALGGKPHGV